MMLRAIGLLCVLLLCAGFWHGTGSTSAPVVTNATFSPSVPASTNQAVGTVSATNSPTSWSITAGDPSGDFAISNAGAITFTAQGQTDYNGGVNLKSATLTVQASNGSTGSGTVTVNGYADGSVNGPGGAAQQPSLLSGYTKRAPWKAAGVDYAVGYGSVTLNDPMPSAGTLAAGLSSLGCVLVSSNTVVQCSGTNCNNATFTNWDFSLHNGLELLLTNCSNPTVKLNNLTAGTNNQNPLVLTTTTSGCTVENNVINGNGQTLVVGFGLIQSNCSGTVTIKYNYIINGFAELIVQGGNTSTATVTIEFNLGMNAGFGSISHGAHGDWIQYQGAAGSTTITDQFNTWVQNVSSASAGTQGLSIASAAGNSQSLAGEAVNFDTMIAASGANVNYPVIIDTTWLNGTATLQNNYIDPTVATAWAFVGKFNSTDGPFSGTVSCGGATNINMTNGATLPTTGLPNSC